jgi:hypothetical protein
MDKMAKNALKIKKETYRKIAPKLKKLLKI